MLDTIFRQYDIRGKVGSELFVDEVYNLAQAIASYFNQRNNTFSTIVIGMDGRVHSQAIKDNLCKGFQDAGIQVTFIGVCPTPVLYFSLFVHSFDAGIMITASHNTQEYNGFKICFAQESVWGEQIQEIKKLYKSKKVLPASKQGIYHEIDVKSEYITWIKKSFRHLIGMKLSVLIDCGNGAGGTVMPELIKAMQWPNVSLLYEKVDGTYPNHEADPIVEKNMGELIKQVTTNKIQLGIGLDGDCDRMAPITSEGKLILGDKLLALFAQSVVQKIPYATVVFDIKCSSGLTEFLDAHAIGWYISPSGHSIIKSKMKIHDALLGGELSCHFFFKDRYFGYDDGIYAMLRLFEIILESRKSLTTLLADFPVKFNTPEIRIACHENEMATIVKHIQDSYEHQSQVKLMTIDGVRVIMKDGWGMIRPSNTQPVLCLRFESDSSLGLIRIKQEFVELLKPYIADEQLKELE